jgi:hypothetical protein
MPDAVTINPIATVTYDCVNNAAANRVEVSCDASNDPADLDFDLDGLATGKQATSLNVAPGSHFNVDIQMVVNKRQPFVVDQVDPLTLVIDDGDLNQIRATAAGGGGQYEYSFNGEDFTTESTYAYYKSGVYTVIVRDQTDVPLQRVESLRILTYVFLITTTKR